MRVGSLEKNLLRRRNPFDSEESKGIINIATSATLDKEVKDFFLNCISFDKTARDKFYGSTLKGQTLQLFGNIPKSKSKSKKVTAKIIYDVNKETAKFKLRKFQNYQKYFFTALNFKRSMKK